MKRSLVLFVSIISSLICLAKVEGKCGNNLTWALEDGVLTISGTGAMPNYSSSSYYPWRSSLPPIFVVVISEGVTSIGSYAFSGCSGLTSVTIGNSVTNIGGNAFYGCNGLTSVTIGNSVTSIGSNAFGNCERLASVNISDLASWCNIDFGNYWANPTYYAHKLVLNGAEIKDLVIPEGITAIKNNAFRGCSGLTSVTIPNSVTSIGDWAFAGCSALKTVTIPSVQISETVFEGCDNVKTLIYTDGCRSALRTYLTSITSVTIPNSVTSIGRSAFSGCTGLTSVTIPNSVMSIGEYAFAYCSGLTSVTIPNSVTSIGYSAFSSYSTLKTVTIPSVQISETVFEGCDNVKTLIYTDGCRSALRTYLTSITSVTIPNSVTRIGDYAFYYCRGLTSITIPNSVTSIGEDAFFLCM